MSIPAYNVDTTTKQNEEPPIKLRELPISFKAPLTDRGHYFYRMYNLYMQEIHYIMILYDRLFANRKSEINDLIGDIILCSRRASEINRKASLIHFKIMYTDILKKYTNFNKMELDTIGTTNVADYPVLKKPFNLNYGFQAILEDMYTHFPQKYVTKENKVYNYIIKQESAEDSIRFSIRETELAEREKQLELKEQKFKQKENELINKENEFNIRKDKQDRLQKELDDRDSKTRKLKDLEDTLKNTNDALNKTRNELTDVSNALAKIKADNKSLLDSLDRLKNEEKQLTTKVDNLIKQNDLLSNKNNALNTENKQLDNSNNNLKNTNSNLVKERDSLETQIKQLKQEYNSLTADLEKLKRESADLIKLKEQRDKLQNEIDQLSTIQKELAGIARVFDKISGLDAIIGKIVKSQISQITPSDKLNITNNDIKTLISTTNKLNSEYIKIKGTGTPDKKKIKTILDTLTQKTEINKLNATQLTNMVLSFTILSEMLTFAYEALQTSSGKNIKLIQTLNGSQIPITISGIKPVGAWSIHCNTLGKTMRTIAFMNNEDYTIMAKNNFGNEHPSKQELLENMANSFITIIDYINSNSSF